MLQDPYELNIEKYANGLVFRGRSTFFYFDICDLYETLNELRKRLTDLNVCAFDLQDWPEDIFIKTPLRYNPGSAEWVYSVIETWVTELENTIHKNKKKRLFDNFLTACKEYVRQSERTELRVIGQWIDKDANYKVFFEQKFIILLVTFGIQVTNDPVMITNFINGLAILSEYLKTKDKKQRIEFNELTKPIFDLIEKDIRRYENIFKVRDSIPEVEFKRMGIHFPFSKKEFLAQINLLTKKQSLKYKGSKVIRNWITYKNSFLDSELNKSDFSMNGAKEINLPQKAIALIYLYNGKLITENNSDTIAAMYGWNSTNSGRKIYTLYCEFINKTNRIGEGISLSMKKINNKIKLIESVLPHLSDEGKSRAADEIKILEIKRYDSSC